MAVRRSGQARYGGGEGLSRRPVALVIVVVLGAVLAYVVAGTAATLLGWSQYGLLALANSVLLVAGGWSLWRRGGLAAAGFRPRPWGQALALSAPLFLAALVTLLLALIWGGGWTSHAMWIYAGLALLVGATEEVLFRALVYGALRSSGVVRGVVVSSALFGLLHTMNIARGAGVAGSLLQVLYAFALGCAFAAALEVAGRLTLLVAAHAATDFFAYVAGAGVLYAGGHDTLLLAVTAFYVVVFGGYAWWLLGRRGLSGTPSMGAPSNPSPS